MQLFVQQLPRPLAVTPNDPQDSAQTVCII